MKRLRQICFIAISILGLTAMSFAQTESARIQGTVTDATGAVVAGATVKVTSVGTGRQVTATSASDGSFTILSLQPGRYSIEVTGPISRPPSKM